MGNLAYNIAQLAVQNGALPKAVRLAGAEVLTAVEAAGRHVVAVSWYNPASTPEHHVPGFAGNGGVAIDFMTYGDHALQDAVDKYLWDNRVRLGVCWIISRRRIRSTSPGHDGQWHPYSGASAHEDHTHANFGHLAGTTGSSKVTKIGYVPPKGAAPAVVPWDGHSFPGADAFYVGAHGDYVTWLGQRLVVHGWTGYTVGPGPDFSALDQAGVAWFQLRDPDLAADADGIPGPLTWARLAADPAVPAAPVVNPAAPTTDVTPEPPVPTQKPWKLVGEYDAPGSGNWQGLVRAADYVYVAHSRKRDGGGEDLVIYRRKAKGGAWDKMTFSRCTHCYGFGVSDTGVVWLTWNDGSGNDVVTVQYKAGVTLTSKAQTQPMHVFTDDPAWVSFSPSRTGLVVMEDVGGAYVFTKRMKQDVLDNVDKPVGVSIRRPTGGWLQGFSVAGDSLLLLYGEPEKKARVERWSFTTGKKVATLDVTETAKLSGHLIDQNEVEGMDARTFSYKINGGDARRMVLVELDQSFTG